MHIELLYVSAHFEEKKAYYGNAQDKLEYLIKSINSAVYTLGDINEQWL